MARLDEEKALASILYLAQKANGSIDMYKLVKLVYLADKKHLLKWGRTITGDMFARMEHGTTPSGVYDMIKAVRRDKDWTRDLSPYFQVHENTVTALIDPDMDEFSESDIEVLDEIFAEHGHKTFGELKALAHDAAWQNASGHWINEEDVAHAESDYDLVEHIVTRREDERFLEGW